MMQVGERRVIMQINEILQFSLQKTIFDMYQKRVLHLFFKSRFSTLSFGTHHKRSMIPSLFLQKKKSISQVKVISP